ncbi:MAG TPA: archease [Thermoanaerobaculia bacterium]|nr:archease [Thermoanaerobaculia bacterium]
MYELLPHTADIRLRVTAESFEELFADAMHGMYAAMRAHPDGGAVQRVIRVDDSADTTSLLVDFLNEVLARAHVARELFTAVRFTRLEERSLEAELTGVAPASFDEDVKAVTYHEADVRRDGDRWTTTLVFDI